MMTQAFYTGLSGLRASSQAIDVISDNLSNTSTIGYRGYSSDFSNMFEGMINTDSGGSSVNSSIGVGVNLNTVSMDESTGVMQITESSKDLAILGDGWFGVQGNGNTFYTRDGSFNFDANRDLVTLDGLFVLGTMGTNISNGELTEQLFEIPLQNVSEQEKLSFPKELYFPPIPTTEASFYGNIDLSEDILTISSGAINSEGVKNNLRLEFTKAAIQVPPGVQWNVTATTETLNGDTIYSTETGVVSFAATGALISNTLSSIDNEGTSIAIDLGTGHEGLISIDAANSVSSSSNGIEDGTLLGYDINKNGEVVATFTNGRQSNVGAIAVYHFANDQGLERINGSRFMQSQNSGEPMFFQDDNGKNIIGTDLATGQLEGSNVRMEVGLTDLIIMQRSYDANSKSISTADEMLQKALSM
jgi:flagellar hook protein FlgE